MVRFGIVLASLLGLVVMSCLIHPSWISDRILLHELQSKPPPLAHISFRPNREVNQIRIESTWDTGRVFGISKTDNSLLWATDIGARLTSDPLVLGEWIFVMSQNEMGSIVSGHWLRIQNGKPQGSFKMDPNDPTLDVHFHPITMKIMIKFRSGRVQIMAPPVS